MGPKPALSATTVTQIVCIGPIEEKENTTNNDQGAKTSFGPPTHQQQRSSESHGLPWVHTGPRLHAPVICRLLGIGHLLGCRVEARAHADLGARATGRIGRLDRSESVRKELPLPPRRMFWGLTSW